MKSSLLVICSITLHIAIYLLLNIQSSPTKVKDFVELELVTSTSNKPAPNPIMVKNKTKKNNPLPQIRFSNLNLKYEPLRSPLNKDSEQAITSSVPKSYDKYGQAGAMGFMNSMGLQQYIEMTPYFEAIWKQINLNLDYPSDISKERIQGKVHISIVVNEKGVFSGDFLEIHSDDPLLSTYAAAILVKALKQPIPQRKWLQTKKEIPLHLTFNFDIILPHMQKEQSKKPFYKNALVFYRQTKLDYHLNEQIQDFFIRTKIPPIIPIPGGFIVDVVVLYKMIVEYGEPTESEKRKIRLKKLKKLLAASLKNNQPEQDSLQKKQN